jgi:hypothetical protein
MDSLVLKTLLEFMPSIMFIPAALLGLSKSDIAIIVGAFSNMFGFGIICICNFNNCIYFLLYRITVPTNKCV